MPSDMPLGYLYTWLLRYPFVSPYTVLGRVDACNPSHVSPGLLHCQFYPKCVLVIV